MWILTISERYQHWKFTGRSGNKKIVHTKFTTNTRTHSHPRICGSMNCTWLPVDGLWVFIYRSFFRSPDFRTQQKCSMWVICGLFLSALELICPLSFTFTLGENCLFSWVCKLFDYFHFITGFLNDFSYFLGCDEDAKLNFTLPAEILKQLLLILLSSRWPLKFLWSSAGWGAEKQPPTTTKERSL